MERSPVPESRRARPQARPRVATRDPDVASPHQWRSASNRRPTAFGRTHGYPAFPAARSRRSWVHRLRQGARKRTVRHPRKSCLEKCCLLAHRPYVVFAVSGCLPYPVTRTIVQLVDLPGEYDQVPEPQDGVVDRFAVAHEVVHRRRVIGCDECSQDRSGGVGICLPAVDAQIQAPPLGVDLAQERIARLSATLAKKLEIKNANSPIRRCLLECLSATSKPRSHSARSAEAAFAPRQKSAE